MRILYIDCCHGSYDVIRLARCVHNNNALETLKTHLTYSQKQQCLFANFDSFALVDHEYWMG